MTASWYESFAAAVDREEPQYRRCAACGESGLPPRQTCPTCGEPEMIDAPLSMSATVVAATEIHVTTPKFEGEAPYTVVIAEFDENVRLTGQLSGNEDVRPGDGVTVGVERREDWPPVITFTPS